MKIPRNISGMKLSKLLKRFGFEITRQTGSHMRLTTTIRGEFHITIPKHKSLKIGTLNNILSDIVNYLNIDKEQLLQELFG
ncbi:MAG: type II toxin-antitoxin system HicA family toxin [Promethearchaeota archaeon]|nr:MAG: type II toxin-antitoxin system HicA family toxin [Candidatus Lokiarchaeota archaeon]